VLRVRVRGADLGPYDFRSEIGIGLIGSCSVYSGDLISM
jgi:hypothetical protein